MTTEYRHFYSVLKCPECGRDLTTPGGVVIETYEEGEGNNYLSSQLDEDGEVEDVDGVIEAGLHCDTLCAVCREPLNDYEVF